MKKLINLLAIILVSIVLSFTQISAASAVIQSSWEVELFQSKSNYLWAKYSTVTNEEIGEFQNFLLGTSNLNQTQLDYYDENQSNTANIADFIILKSRSLIANDSQTIDHIDISDIGYIEMSDEIPNSSEIGKYDFNNDGVINALDLSIAKEFFKIQMPEINKYGGSNTVIKTIHLALKYESNSKTLIFHTGDFNNYTIEQPSLVFVGIQGEPHMALKENDGSYFLSDPIGYHFSQYIEKLDTPTEWFAILS